MATRRAFIKAFFAAGALPAFDAGLAQGALLEPTPACGADAKATPRQTEGPFYTPKTPRKANFTGDAKGEKIALAGFVLDRKCQPVAGVIVDLWQADARGEYDNNGFRLRGHQITDARGRFAFETIVPGLYPGRARHYHVKLIPPGRRPLTTQLYFPGDPGNAGDRIYNKALEMRVGNAADGKTGRFDFVIEG